MQEISIPFREVFEHILCLGASGAGKSSSLFIPNLFRLAERLNAGQEIPNVVVTDPKGELLRLTGPLFRQAGARVWVFHPLDPEVSMAVNTIKYADNWEVADRIAWTVVKNTGQSKSEPFFDNTARLLLAMIILLCRTTCADATMNHVHAVGTLVSTSDMESFLCNSKDPMLSMQAKGFYSRVKRNERLMGSIESDLPPRLNLWNLDPIRAVTSKSEIDFFDFYKRDEEHDKPTILYVINPFERKDQLAPLMATFFTEFFLATVEVAKKQPDGKLPRRVWFMLDEFNNIGHIPGFNEFLTTSRGFGAGLVLGVQSRSRLNEVYDESGGETIVNSCATYICYPRIGPEDAKWLSSVMGDTTVRSHGKSFSMGDILAKRNENETKRPLLTPDEIRALSPKKIIIIAGTRRPVMVDQMRWYEQPQWKDNQLAEWGVFKRANGQLEVPQPEHLVRDIMPSSAPSAANTKRQIKPTTI